MEIFDLIPLFIVLGLIRKLFDFIKEYNNKSKTRGREFKYNDHGLYENKMAKKDQDLSGRSQEQRKQKKDELEYEKVNNQNINAKYEDAFAADHDQWDDEIEDYSEDKLEETANDEYNIEQSYREYGDYVEYKDDYDDNKDDKTEDEFELFDPDNIEKDVLKGIVMKEILDKPRAQKHYRPPNKR